MCARIFTPSLGPETVTAEKRTTTQFALVPPWVKLTDASGRILNVVEVVELLSSSETLIFILVRLHLTPVCAARAVVGVTAATETAKPPAASKAGIVRCAETIFYPLCQGHCAPNECPTK